jgi:REP element-mobilizing transposase RayT
MVAMPRILRIQYAGARYHVINRGNYRANVFSSEGAVGAFLCALDECARRFGWKIHAYVIMRNHYHLALETPQPNLAAGMHWLQGTFASRFNRFRGQHGRLFQGPYKALLLEDANALCRVVDYIHLNPVRAGVVGPEDVARFAWSSLHVLSGTQKNKRAAGLVAAQWLEARGGWCDTAGGIAAYVRYLQELGGDGARQKKGGLTGLSRGWAIGTHGWKRAVAREYAQRSLVAGEGMEKDEIDEIRRLKNEELFERAIKRAGKTETDLHTRFFAPPWKTELALGLRDAGVPVTWIAEKLRMGKPASVRSILSRQRNAKAP